MQKVLVKIEGLNLSRLVDKLISKGVFIQNLKVKNSYIKFELLQGDFDEFKTICKQERKDYEVLQHFGFKFLISKLKYCFGFMLALVLSFCYLYSQSVFVYHVDVVVDGQENYDTIKVERFLSDIGVAVGVKKQNIDVQKIENLLNVEFEDLLGCSASLDGGRFLVYIKPAVLKNDPLPKQVFSKYDAVITSVEMFSGNAKVKIGDIVKKGDLLMEGENGVSGKIYGKVYFSETYLHNENQTIQEKTGKVFVLKNYKYRKKYLFKQENNSGFINYLAEKCDFYILNNFFLPIKCEEFLLYETVLKEVKVSFESVKNDVFEKIKNAALSKIEDKNSIKNTTFSVVEDGGYTRVDCFVETELLIA